MKAGRGPVVGLISMPWMAATMPSIQLAVLGAALKQAGVVFEVHELFLDYAASIGLNLYNILSINGGFIEEWLFAQYYFGAETENVLTEFRTQRRHFRFRFQLESVELEDQVLDAVTLVTADFLDSLITNIDWPHYDIIGFSLTHSQLASSMTLARLIKKRYPKIRIVFGGAQCTDPMGPTILRICPYVDVVVRVDGELIFPELVHRIRAEQRFEDLPGISWRTEGNKITSNPAGKRYRNISQRPLLDFDPYFERLKRLKLAERIKVWLPFESSRGCWYGEKIQCTFCGLHQIMDYRLTQWQSILAELEAWHQRYGLSQFFAVDLIMPHTFLNTLLPEIARRKYDWLIFYEMKANLKRSDVEILAAAGVRWIQPGLESLDNQILKLMKKGVSAWQNIQLLKWCAEMGIYISWNILYGFPGEPAEVYGPMAERMQLLYHLMPPSGIGPFQLHRYSPYFDAPEAFGIKNKGPHPLYKYIFPVPEADLNDLVYLYHYSLADDASPRTYIQPVLKAIQDWRAAHMRKASLTFHIFPDGAAEIRDTRTLPETTHYLTTSETCLYLFLDAAKIEKTLAVNFSRLHPQEAQALTERGGIECMITTWREHGLIFCDDGRLLAIAVNTTQQEPTANPQQMELAA